MAGLEVGESGFVAEFPLELGEELRLELLARLESARRLYNVCLEEALRRLDAFLASKRLAAAMAKPEGAARGKAMRNIALPLGLSEAGLGAFAAKAKKAGPFGGLTQAVVKAVAARAYAAVWGHAQGRLGRPRFKSPSQFWKLAWDPGAKGLSFYAREVVFSGLRLPAAPDGEGWRVLRSPSYGAKPKGRARSVSIVRRESGGGIRYFAQLT